jgi:hypothetical protein
VNHAVKCFWSFDPDHPIGLDDQEETKAFEKEWKAERKRAKQESHDH